MELLARNLNFGRVYGISAGSSHTVNYLVRDPSRARASFVELVKHPRFGGWGSFLAGHGYFNGPYLYEELIENAPAGDPMTFDWDTFAANPAEMHIEAMDWNTGETVAWTRADVKDAHDLGLKVRASSTMPIFMPPTTIDGRTYMDGGMGDSWGILLNAARADGYERFCIIRTQPRGYRKHAMSRAAQALFRAAFRAHPIVAERTIARWQPYNELCDEIEHLEEAGRRLGLLPRHHGRHQQDHRLRRPRSLLRNRPRPSPARHRLPPGSVAGLNNAFPNEQNTPCLSSL